MPFQVEGTRSKLLSKEALIEKHRIDNSTSSAQRSTRRL